MALSVSPAARKQAENALIPEALAAFEERARVVREAMKARSHRLQNLNVSASGGVTPFPYGAMRATGVSAGAPSPR
jgi:predicted secreted protein